MTTTITRKRINFMVDVGLLEELETLVPAGGRSDFVNDAMEHALSRFAIKKAMEETDKLRKKLHLKIGSDAQLLKAIRYGRK